MTIDSSVPAMLRYAPDQKDCYACGGMSPKKEAAMYRYGILMLLGVLAIGCASSPGNGEILHLRGGDISEDNYRSATRSHFLEAQSYAEALCNSADGLSWQEVLDLVRPTDTPKDIDAPGTTPIK